MLVVAGVAKLVDRGGARESLRGFGVPESATGLAAVLLPLTELVLAAGLLATSTARWTAGVAAGLFAVFGVALARALARGEHPECHCFGQLSQAPAGPAALVRNGVLAALSAFVVIAPGAPGGSITAWLVQLSSAGTVAFWLGLALALISAAAVWFGRELLAQQGHMLLRLEELEAARPRAMGLPRGAPAPGFALPTPGGDTLTLQALLDLGLPVLLVFSDIECGPCAEAVAVLGRAQRTLRGRLTIALISKGTTPARALAWVEHSIEHVGITSSHDLGLSFGAPGTPSAVIVSPDGRVDSRLVSGLAHITSLLAAPPGLDEERETVDGADDDAFELALTSAGGVA